MAGVKSQARLKSFMTAPLLYRTIAANDGVVTPATPPAVPFLDLSASPVGLNTVQILATPTTGDAPVLELWVVVTPSKWHFVGTKTLVSGRPEVWTVENLPALKVAVVVVSGISGGPLTLLASTSA